jgi:hypothetical protein
MTSLMAGKHRHNHPQSMEDKDLIKYQQQSNREYRQAMHELRLDPPPEVKRIAREQYDIIQKKIAKWNKKIAEDIQGSFFTRHSPTIRKLVVPHLKECYPLEELKRGGDRLKRFFAHKPPPDPKSKHLSPDELDELKERNPIQDIYEFNFTNMPDSRRLFSVCPLHEDNDPSLVIYTDQNSFYCYGCNKGGDVITFIQELHGCGFKEALAYLK